MIESNMSKEDIEALLFEVIKKRNNSLTLDKIYEEEGIRRIK